MKKGCQGRILKCGYCKSKFRSIGWWQQHSCAPGQRFLDKLDPAIRSKVTAPPEYTKVPRQKKEETNPVPYYGHYISTMW